MNVEILTGFDELSDYRQPLQSAADPPRAPAELSSVALSAMSYDGVVDWCGGDFERLVAVAKVRDYRPEWIAHQIQNHGRHLLAQESEFLARMVAEAGPYISRRRRWIMRQLRVKPLTENALATMALSAVEYRDYKYVPRCVRSDLAGLVSLGLVHEHGGQGSRCRGSGPQP